MNARRLLLFVIISSGLVLQAGAKNSRNARVSDARKRQVAQPMAQFSPSKSTTDPVLSEADEERRYQQAKAKAKADPTVKSLKAKSEAALTETEARETLIAYNKALFGKVRAIDGSIGERASLIETAILRRIGE